MATASFPASPAAQLDMDGAVLTAYEVNGEIVTRLCINGKQEAPTAVTAGQPKRAGEQWSCPRLIIGPDGVPWLFYLSELRRMTYYHRWLGEGWGQRFDGRGVFHAEPYDDNSFDENLLPISRFELSGAQGEPAALTLATLQYPYKVVTHTIDAPELQAKPGAGELFLDTMSVASAEGLAWAMEEATKHSRNPILKPTFKPGTPDEGGAMQHGTVLLDDGRFRMWYTGWEIPGHGPVPLEKNWDHYVHVCYAESDNGIDWQRVNLGLVEYMGNRNNNLVPSLWLRPVIMRDDLELDPERRYKCWEQTWPSVSFPGRGQLHTSPDGIRWSTEDSPRALPGTRPHWFGWDSVFRDEDDPDPERRWKAYGYFSTSGLRRTAGHAFSSNSIRWTCYPENPIIDPLQGVRTTCHDFVVWREQGLYIGLLQVGDITVRDYDFELVVSRDGIHFSRIADGRSFLQRGAEEDWDPGSICVFHNGPVFVRDQAWFYYGAKTSSAHKKFDVEFLMGAGGLGSVIEPCLVANKHRAIVEDAD